MLKHRWVQEGGRGKVCKKTQRDLLFLQGFVPCVCGVSELKIFEKTKKNTIFVNATYELQILPFSNHRAAANKICKIEDLLELIMKAQKENARTIY